MAAAVPLPLWLQKSAGNQAVSRALAAHRALSRQVEAAPARTAQQRAALDEDITQAIAQKETGRKAIESDMRTSAGVRASYASQVQATAQWSVSALLKLDDARLASFGLTRAELRDANARMVAAGAIWDSIVIPASAPDRAAFAASNPVRMAASGLTQADIDRIFDFREVVKDLERRLADDKPTRKAELLAMTAAAVWDAATAKERRRAGARTKAKMNLARHRDLADAIAHRETAAAVAAGLAATTLGIPAGTIEVLRMRNGVRNYGEDRAAWQRVAAGREPPGDTVGERLDAASTADGGLRLGRARIAHINELFLAANPTATDDQVCDNAARAHNRGNPLTEKVRGFFHKFQRDARRRGARVRARSGRRRRLDHAAKQAPDADEHALEQAENAGQQAADRGYNAGDDDSQATEKSHDANALAA